MCRKTEIPFFVNGRSWRRFNVVVIIATRESVASITWQLLDNSIDLYRSRVDGTAMWRIIPHLSIANWKIDWPQLCEKGKMSTALNLYLAVSCCMLSNPIDFTSFHLLYYYYLFYSNPFIDTRKSINTCQKKIISFTMQLFIITDNNNNNIIILDPRNTTPLSRLNRNRQQKQVCTVQWFKLVGHQFYYLVQPFYRNLWLCWNQPHFDITVYRVSKEVFCSHSIFSRFLIQFLLVRWWVVGS